jgi:hypothetical protein
MQLQKRHKVIITGTGRAGTTFLVQLLTELGLGTGYAPGQWRRDMLAHCGAGLEHDIEDPAAPYIVKNPALCETLPDVLARGQIAVDLALIPVRRLEDAAQSRVRVGGGDGLVPGGLVGTADPGKQQSVLAESFHRLVETLAAYDIPQIYLHFPRFAQDAAYTYGKLRPLLGAIDRDRFDACFARVARPEMIHTFADGVPDDAGRPARMFVRQRHRRKLFRRLGRAATLCLFGAGGWTVGLWTASTGAPAAPSPAPANIRPLTLAMTSPAFVPVPHRGLVPLARPGAAFPERRSFETPPPDSRPPPAFSRSSIAFRWPRPAAIFASATMPEIDLGTQVAPEFFVR